MRRLALSVPLILIGLAPALADPLPVNETTYIERSLKRDGPLVIEHRPIARAPSGRRAGSEAEIAGFCRDGAHIRRLDEFGRPVIIRQREVCDSVAPRTMEPGVIDPRPTWPAEAVPTQRVLRSRG